MPLHIVAPDAKTRRVRRLSLNADRWLDLLRSFDGRLVRLETPIPEDARVVGFSVDAPFDTIRLYVESETFPETPESQEPEEWELSVDILLEFPA